MKLQQPTLLVIVGITGDLAKRYLMPAIYNLQRDGLIDELRIVGTSRKPIDKDALRETFKEWIIAKDGECDDSALDTLLNKISITSVDFDDNQAVHAFNQLLKKIEQEVGSCTHRLFYLSVPAKVAPSIAEAIGVNRLDRCIHDSAGTILMEKPFGRDSESAQEVIDMLGKYFQEKQIYRIDHYLAKETARNISYFRFKNPIVNDLWSSKYIDHIQITVAESLSIEGRASFYEQTGAIRDMVQSHLLQLVALTTMDSFADFTADEVRKNRTDVFKNILQVNLDDVVVGQYEGYKEDVDNPSNVETYVALKLFIDNEHWQGVPIYLRTGKALSDKVSEINISYKDDSESDSADNILTLRLQPNEGIAIKLAAKKPGLDRESQEIVLDYCYERSGHEIRHSAYDKILIDAFNFDQTYFASTEEVIETWRILNPLVKGLEDLEIEMYEKGTWGPGGADKLLKRDGRKWMHYDKAICKP